MSLLFEGVTAVWMGKNLLYVIFSFIENINQYIYWMNGEFGWKLIIKVILISMFSSKYLNKYFNILIYHCRYIKDYKCWFICWKAREKEEKSLIKIIRTTKIFVSNRDKPYLLSKILLYIIKLNEDWMLWTSSRRFWRIRWILLYNS